MIVVLLAPLLPLPLMVLNICAIIKYLPQYAFTVTYIENEYGASYLFSVSSSLILSILPTIFRCLENEESYWLLSKNLVASSFVTPCLISKSIFLRTFVKLPEYFLCCFF